TGRWRRGRGTILRGRGAGGFGRGATEQRNKGPAADYPFCSVVLLFRCSVALLDEDPEPAKIRRRQNRRTGEEPPSKKAPSLPRHPARHDEGQPAGAFAGKRRDAVAGNEHQLPREVV